LEITTCNANGPSGHASSCDPNQGHRPNQGLLPKRPSRGPSLDHRCSAVGPNGHASSVVPIARPSCCLCLRWQPPEAGGLVLPG
jgi:hypothetical protein